MSRKLFTRLFALVSMLVLLALVSFGSQTVWAQKACDLGCLRDCFDSNGNCVYWGAEGCDAVLTDCLCNCGCLGTGC
jgi:hypothetical protein